MQYFVSIANLPYFHWQVDLLIESFRFHGIDKDLAIAIAHNDNEDHGPKFLDYSKNLVSHKNKFFHNNYGKEFLYSPLNQVTSLSAALENGYLEQPFALLHPDMMLVDPISDITENVVFHRLVSDEAKDEFVHLEEHIETIAKSMKISRKDLPEWLPVGGVIVFNDVPLEFFHRWQARIMNLLDSPEGFGPEWTCNKTALVLTLYEYLGKNLTYKGEHLECTMLDHDLANVIHYKNGMPPVFSKHKYLRVGEGWAGDDPVSVILQHNPTPATNYMNEIARLFRK